MSRSTIDIPQKRSELEATRKRLLEMKAPPQHVEYIDMLLADVDSGHARCVPEDPSTDWGPR